MRLTYWRPGGVGDAILSIPALQILRRRQEDGATIHFVGHLRAGELLRTAGLVDVAHKQSARSSPDNLYSGAVEISGRLGMRFDEERRRVALQSMGNPDLCVAFSTDAISLSYAFEELGVPRYTVQHWQPPIGTHQAEFQVLALRNLGYTERYNHSPNYTPIDWKCQPPLTPYLNTARAVVLSPGAGMDFKRWPLDRWVELAQKLDSLGSEVLVLEGPSESSLDYRRKFLGSRVLSLSLQDAAGLLSLRMPFIGNDSGLTHLAAMSGCPTIGLYGPTHPTEWSPLGPDVYIIRNCASEPTGNPRVCFDPECMNKISVHNVLDVFIRKVK